MLWVMREEPIDRGVRCEDGMPAVNTLYIDGQHGQSLHVCVCCRAAGCTDILYAPVSGARRRAARIFFTRFDLARGADIFERRSQTRQGRLLTTPRLPSCRLSCGPDFVVFWGPLALMASRLHDELSWELSHRKRAPGAAV